MNIDNLLIELSHNCNLNCIMCGYGQGVSHPDRFMTIELFYYIMEKIGHKAKNIRLNGRGESTIHPNFLEIVRYLNKNYVSIHLSLFSNLSFRDDKIIDALMNQNIELYISFDSPFKETLLEIRRNSNFENIISNINQLMKKRNRPFIVFTLQELNWHSIVDISEFALNNNLNLIYNVVRKDQGFEEFVSIIIENKNAIKSAFMEVEKKFKKSDLICKIPDQIAGVRLFEEKFNKTISNIINCPLIEKEICICYDGEILPCNMFNTHSYGYIRNSSIVDIKKQIQIFKDLQPEHYYCKNCAYIGSN